jgi:hypothetical protein
LIMTSKVRQQKEKDAADQPDDSGTSELAARLLYNQRFRKVMVHDVRPVDEVTLEPHEPFSLQVELEDTVAKLKSRILEHRDVPVTEASMRGLKLVYCGEKLTKDSAMLKNYYYAHAKKGSKPGKTKVTVNGHKFAWSHPYIGIVWITPSYAEPSNEAIAQYATTPANVVRRAQGDICADFYGSVASLAETQARAAGALLRLTAV